MKKAGRKESLTKELALEIATMIEAMPISGIPVSWDQVRTHIAKRFKRTFSRQILSQKEWDGKKLILLAFKNAGDVETRLQADRAPKYKTASRAVLQKRIADLEAINFALSQDLERVRAQQIDALDVFLNTGCDLRMLVERLKD